MLSLGKMEPEDAPPGIEAAHAAGMRVIAVASTYPRERLASADAVVDSVSDLDVVPDGAELRIDIP